MTSIKGHVESALKHLEQRLGIDRQGRTVWVWLLPPSIGLVAALLVPSCLSSRVRWACSIG